MKSKEISKTCSPRGRTLVLPNVSSREHHRSACKSPIQKRNEKTEQFDVAFGVAPSTYQTLQDKDILEATSDSSRQSRSDMKRLQSLTTCSPRGLTSSCLTFQKENIIDATSSSSRRSRSEMKRLKSLTTCSPRGRTIVMSNFSRREHH